MHDETESLLSRLRRRLCGWLRPPIEIPAPCPGLRLRPLVWRMYWLQVDLPLVCRYHNCCASGCQHPEECRAR